MPNPLLTRGTDSNEEMSPYKKSEDATGKWAPPQSEREVKCILPSVIDVQPMEE